jgi:hypothetical protein
MGKKTAELTGIALDRAVAHALGAPDDGDGLPYYSTDWAQGGPIIEREEIDLGVYRNDCWRASKYVGDSITANGYGPTPLIAAMRCYVVLKLGVAVDIPDELK